MHPAAGAWTPRGPASLQDIAICGFSCRFAGDAVDSGKFWEMLCQSRSKFALMYAPLHSAELDDMLQMRTPVPLVLETSRSDRRSFRATISLRMCTRSMRVSSASREQRPRPWIHPKG
jgi:hypothetical protein